MTDNTHELSVITQGLSDETRALIPAGLRPDLAHGLALWLAGHSTHEASRISGCPQTTLWEHARALPASVKDGRAKYADAIEDIVFPVVKEAYAQIGERMAEGKLKAGELNFIAGTGVDKIVALRRLKQGHSGEASPIDSLLSKLGATGGTVTMTVEPNRVIDVEARVVEESER